MSQTAFASNLLPQAVHQGRFILAEGVPGITVFREGYASLSEALTAALMLPRSVAPNWGWGIFDQKKGDWLRSGGDGAKLCIS